MNNFTYIRPQSLTEAGKLSGESWQDAQLLAGGTDLLSLLKEQIINPEKIINLKTIPDLTGITYRSGKGLQIGALTTITEISEHPVIKHRFTALAEAAAEVASPQLRNQGTIGGNLCQRPRCWYFREEFDCLRKGGDICYAVDGENKYHCIIGGNPCFIVHPSDTAVALLALNASVTIFKNKRTRTIAVRDFFQRPDQNVEQENILTPGEIITHIQIPEQPTGTVSGFLKFKERAVWDFAVVSTAIVVNKSGATIQNGRVALGGVAPVPWPNEFFSANIKGMSATVESIKKLCDGILQDAEPLSDNEYKLLLARSLSKRLLSTLCV